MRVTADRRDIWSFMDHWPASGLRGLNAVSAIFDSRGDLVDLTTNGRYGAGKFDGAALSALVGDMQKYGNAKLGIGPAPSRRR